MPLKLYIGLLGGIAIMSGRHCSVVVDLIRNMEMRRNRQ